MIIGNPSPDGGAGGTYVVYGGNGDSLLLASLTPARGFRISGPAGSGIDAGHSVASAGDVNRDGLADIIICVAPRSQGAGQAAGPMRKIHSVAGSGVALARLGAEACPSWYHLLAMIALVR
jgi:hypothetical protein